MRLEARSADIRGIKADLAAIFLYEDRTLLRRQIERLRGFAGRLPPHLENGSFGAKEEESISLYPAAPGMKQLLLVGLGKRSALSAEKLRRGSAAVLAEARRARARHVAMLEPLDGMEDREQGRMSDPEETGLALGEGAILGSYAYVKYITDRKRAEGRLPARLEVISGEPERLEKLNSGLRLAAHIAGATAEARDLANAPGNEIHPESLARLAQRSGRKYGFSVSVFDEKRLARMRMGGLLGVAQGSAKPPRLIVMEYNGGPKRQSRRSLHGPVALVGKGVTFDAGGISIKPSANMAEQKADMAGAAAVIGTMRAVSSLRLPIRLIGLVPAAENMPSGTALKPGDIVRHFNGTTSEIENTDAEGRLILADALAYAARFSPTLTIDVATLTGACVVALGHVATGMMGNDQESMDRLAKSGERTHERVWQLPLFEEYDRLIKSDIADVKNTGGRWAGAITGAMFLRRFIGSRHWVHLDIAGTATAEESGGYIPRGATGVGVRLLTDFLRYNYTRY